MPKCPKCSREINRLRYIEIDTETGELFRGAKELFFIADTEYTMDTNYYCPQCKEKLFGDNDTAKLFLEGVK